MWRFHAQEDDLVSRYSPRRRQFQNAFVGIKVDFGSPSRVARRRSRSTARRSALQIVRRRVPAAFANPLPLLRDGHAAGVAVSPRANPHLGPCRRDRQGLETFQHIRLRELRLVGPSVNPFPAFSRRMPGRASETYLRPADSAAPLGSTIACALSAGSTTKKRTLHLPKKQTFVQVAWVCGASPRQHPSDQWPRPSRLRRPGFPLSPCIGLEPIRPCHLRHKPRAGPAAPPGVIGDQLREIDLAAARQAQVCVLPNEVEDRAARLRVSVVRKCMGSASAPSPQRGR